MNILEICNWLVDRPQIIELASKMLAAKSSTHDEINLNLDISYNNGSKRSFTSNEVSVILILKINN